MYYAHLIVPFAPRKVLAFDNKNEKKCFFFLYYAHLIVPLTDVEGRMRLNNKNKTNFILYCVRLSLPLTDVEGTHVRQ